MEAERAKRIKELQKEKDVVILAHYYVTVPCRRSPIMWAIPFI